MSELYPVAEKSVVDLQADMAAGSVDSAGLVAAYLGRIEAIDRSGPTLRSVIALNPKALDDARRLDDERRAGALRGPLHGVPVLVKDNIDTDDGTATTAGSLALAENVTLRDAPVVARLKAAGGGSLGKTNPSEWAKNRSTRPAPPGPRRVGRRRPGEEPLCAGPKRFRLVVGDGVRHRRLSGRGRRRHRDRR